MGAHAQNAIRVSVSKISDQDVGDKIGAVILEPTSHGVLIRPILEGLEPGMHGFHLHEKASPPYRSRNSRKTAPASAMGVDKGNVGTCWGAYEKACWKQALSLADKYRESVCPPDCKAG
ncbi:Cu/Zn superoxide dismutase [Hahella chejuensis KCTC 2396]|uniref:Cu/Zn superoxide dismutase n=1 Tax=Hahella chejuensis (strain KCTC 2396) TaxID=349521 RepID=Q2SGG3_HAHCH|nr:Cu/Zn superoxide dismutase [Hahella chejuensis]ABC30261.1 Cu/Zn superoxide dismutase [Hahella chejuensis KCTC 2396]